RSAAAGSSWAWSRAEALLRVGLEGATGAELDERVAEARLSLAAMAIAQRVGRDTDEIEALWSIRHAASPILAAIRDGRRSLQVIEDGCVPVGRLGEYLDAVERACADARIDAVMFGHAGDGHVHVNLLPDVNGSDWQPRVRSVFDEVSSALIRLGGTPAGEHGAEIGRASCRDRACSPGV